MITTIIDIPAITEFLSDLSIFSFDHLAGIPIVCKFIIYT